MTFDKLDIEHASLVRVVVSVQYQIILADAHKLFTKENDFINILFEYRHEFTLALVFNINAKLLLCALVRWNSVSMDSSFM